MGSGSIGGGISVREELFGRGVFLVEEVELCAIEELFSLEEPLRREGRVKTILWPADVVQ